MNSMVFNDYLSFEHFIPIKGKKNWLFKTVDDFEISSQLV